MPKIDLATLDIKGLIKCKTRSWTARNDEQFTLPESWPDIYIRNHYIRGLLSTLGQDEGAYPLPYLDFIDDVFGAEPDTLELCSRYVRPDNTRTKYTVDINPNFQPTWCCDVQTLSLLPPSLRVKRIRADPPYNVEAAREKYGTDLPDFMAMLRAGSRYLEVGGLFIMLMGPVNYQVKVDALGMRHIGTIALTVVPNFELRACNIWLKVSEGERPFDDGNRQAQLGFQQEERT